MRSRTLGRWVGRVAAVSAIGMGTLAGVSAVTAAHGTTPAHTTVAEASATESAATDATPAGNEWT